MLIYISSKITGLSEDEYKKIFDKAEIYLDIYGHKTINPLKVDPFGNKQQPTWSDYMRADIIELCKCDAIYMCGDWQNSEGAKLELMIAIRLGLKIIFQCNNIQEL